MIKDILSTEDDRNQVFLIQERAQKMYGSIRGMARATGMTRKVMDRAYLNGLSSLIPKNMLRLCAALKITPNQFYGFEEMPPIPFEFINLQTSKRIKLSDALTYREIHDKLNSTLFIRGNK